MKKTLLVLCVIVAMAIMAMPGGANAAAADNGEINAATAITYNTADNTAAIVASKDKQSLGYTGQSLEMNAYALETAAPNQLNHYLYTASEQATASGNTLTSQEAWPSTAAYVNINNSAYDQAPRHNPRNQYNGSEVPNCKASAGPMGLNQAATATTNRHIMIE